MLAGLKSSDSSSSLGLQTSISIGLKPPPSDYATSFNDREFVNHMSIKRSSSIRMTYYSLVDLQTATGNFATGRLLGEGTIGRVYRAKYADGKVFFLLMSFCVIIFEVLRFSGGNPGMFDGLSLFDQLKNGIICNRSLVIRS